MRTTRASQVESQCAFPGCSRIRLSRYGLLASLAALILFVLLSIPTDAVFAAQNSTPPGKAAPPTRKADAVRHKSNHEKPRPGSTNIAQPAPQPAPVPAKAPDWPANASPTTASVTWDSHGLLVVASNSSLTQILKEISLDTGIKVEGIGKDERIFGTYGPAPARDVLSQLLDGTNYDVLMVGDQGQGTPRRVVLTARSGGAPATQNANSGQPSNQDSGSDDEPQQSDDQQPDEPPQAQPPPNFTPGMPMRTQQQLIEEMQERQRQLQQQQQQQNQNPQ